MNDTWSLSNVYIRKRLSYVLLLSYDPGVDSTSSRNEYQEHFLGVKLAGA